MSVSRKDHTAIVSRASTLRVDKARFLLLASALAAAGCSSSDSSNGGPAATTGAAGNGGHAGAAGSAGRPSSGGAAGSSSGRGGAGGSGGAAGSDAGTAGRSGSGGASGSGGTAGASGAGGSSGTGGNGGTSEGGVADGGMMEAGKADAASDGSARDAQGDGFDAASRETGGDAGCYDATGTAPYCVGLPPSCPWQDTYCVSTREGMKGGVGQAFVACLQGLTGCSSPEAYSCARRALNGACSDATADSLCSTIEGTCSGLNAISSADCHKLVDGLNWWGRYRVQNCILPPDGGTDGGAACQTGLWSCVEGI